MKILIGIKNSTIFKLIVLIHEFMCGSIAILFLYISSLPFLLLETANALYHSHDRSIKSRLKKLLLVKYCKKFPAICITSALNVYYLLWIYVCICIISNFYHLGRALTSPKLRKSLSLKKGRLNST